MTPDAKPAEVLLGATLDHDWVVTAQIARADDATGGAFSISYFVERGEGFVREAAFLKALDFTMVTELGLPIADALQLVTNAYVFERNLVLDCAGRRMTNVVRGLDAGEVTIDTSAVAPQYAFLSSVPYIIFEIADGDVRTMLANEEQFDAAWSFRILHGIANGLRQLHQAGIAHQDLKPSNVMTFDKVAKVGDLGRASPAGGGMFDETPVAGDPTYAPPELLYGELHPHDRTRRRAGDMYHLGSMAVFLFAGAGLTPLIEAELDTAFHWRTWPRGYRNALPYVRDAFDRVLMLVADRVPERLRCDFITVVRELADPDPLHRGNSAHADGLRRYGMERYVSVFDRLSRQAEIDLRGARAT